MAPSDLLSTIRGEIDTRLSDLRPLLAEYEQLLTALRALDSGEGSSSGSPQAPRRVGATGSRASRANRRGSAAGAIRRAASATRANSTRKPRASRGAAREAILGALEHGSHTVGELATVTAMSAPNISANVRRLLIEGAIAKTQRGGRTAYALAGDSTASGR